MALTVHEDFCKIDLELATRLYHYSFKMERKTAFFQQTEHREKVKCRKALSHNYVYSYLIPNSLNIAVPLRAALLFVSK